MKTIAGLLLAFFFFTSISAAQSKELDLKGITLHPDEYLPAKLQQIQWEPMTDEFTYVIVKNNNAQLVFESAKNKRIIKRVYLKTINNYLKSLTLDTLTDFPKIKWKDGKVFCFWDNNNLIEFNDESKKAEVVNSYPKNEKVENIDYDAPKLVAYSIKNNLYVAVNGNQFAVTADEDTNLINGQLVSRGEFGITKGTFWSPHNNYLAFYRKDVSDVFNYPMVDISYRPAKLEMYKYPMAGSKSEKLSVGIYSIKTHKVIWLKIGEPKVQYLTNVTWSPDEKYIYIAQLNREQNHLRLIKYDVNTGGPVKTLFEEKDDKYVQPLHGPQFFTNDPDHFVWFSQRDGWNHLYYYDSNGNLIKKLTNGDWVVTDFNGYDKSGKNIFYTSTEFSPLDRQVYKLDLSSGKITRLTKHSGTHKVISNSERTYFLDEYNSLNIPYEVLGFNEDGNSRQNFYEASNPLNDYKMGKTKIFKIQNKGYELYCRIIFPPGFDSTKKYPVIDYVYGGPEIQVIKDIWLGDDPDEWYEDSGLWLNFLAEKGYLVFTMDPRGSYNRGLKFEQEIYRNLGTPEMEDEQSVVKYLKSLPYVDSTKLGVNGWSFGGYMTTSLMTRTPGLFKVGVGGGTVINWKYYEVMYTERYMDTPQENPEGYNETNLLNYAGNLKGKLLLVHGTMDSTVLWQHTLMFCKKAADLGIPLDYFPYPGHQHHILGVDAYQLYQKIYDYFKENL
jgi:dipeptidyl-peptidase 4